MTLAVLVFHSIVLSAPSYFGSPYLLLTIQCYGQASQQTTTPCVAEVIDRTFSVLVLNLHDSVLLKRKFMGGGITGTIPAGHV